MKTMTYITITFIIIIYLMVMPYMAQAATTNQITQFGITWTFDKSYEYGQFVNGDYWVVGPVKVMSISPGWDGSLNGSMLNPVPGSHHGYDGRAVFYDPSLTVTVSSASPLSLQANDSLVSTISQAVTQTTNTNYLKTAAILTVLASAPPQDAFRPAYVKGPKTIYRASQIHYELLPGLTPVAGTPDPGNFVSKFQRVWLDHLYEQGGWDQEIHPVDNMPSYSENMTVPISDTALLLLVNTPQDKQQLLINFLQLGIDNYYTMMAAPDKTQLWQGNGGHGNGRKLPIIFAGLMFNDNGMKNVPGVFGEDDQTYYYDDPNLDVTDSRGYPKRGVKGWTGATALWGIAHGATPDYDHEHLSPMLWTADGRGWPGDPAGSSVSNYRSEGYRNCCTSYTWVGEALAARLMHAENYWNHNAFFDYVDRWMTEDWKTTPRPEFGNRTFEQVVTDNSGGYDGLSFHQGETSSAFVTAMWAAYRPFATGEPMANFVFNPTQGKPPLTVSFDASASTDSDGYIASYSWNFGDGYTSTGVQARHAYVNTGTFIAVLTVTDNDGKIGTSTKNIIVYDVAPAALHLTFDGDAKDYSGYNHNTSIVSLNGFPIFVSGKINQAIEFDDSGSTNTGPYVNVPHASDLGGMANLTFSFWAKKNTASVGGYIVHKQATYYISLGLNTITGYLFTGADSGGGARLDFNATTSAISDTYWHHYALTYDGSAVKIYVDGSSIWTGSLSGSISMNPDQNITVGKNPWGASFNGMIDDLRIYGTALSASDIANIINPPAVISSDINGDGKVDSIDLQLMINMILAGTYDSKADLNKDSTVNAIDLQALVNIILGQ